MITNDRQVNKLMQLTLGDGHCFYHAFLTAVGFFEDTTRIAKRLPWIYQLRQVLIHMFEVNISKLVHDQEGILPIDTISSNNAKKRLEANDWAESEEVQATSTFFNLRICVQYLEPIYSEGHKSGARWVWHLFSPDGFGSSHHAECNSMQCGYTEGCDGVIWMILKYQHFSYILDKSCGCLDFLNSHVKNKLIDYISSHEKIPRKGNMEPVMLKPTTAFLLRSYNRNKSREESCNQTPRVGSKQVVTPHHPPPPLSSHHNMGRPCQELLSAVEKADAFWKEFKTQAASHLEIRRAVNYIFSARRLHAIIELKYAAAILFPGSTNLMNGSIFSESLRELCHKMQYATTDGGGKDEGGTCLSIISRQLRIFKNFSDFLTNLTKILMSKA